MTLTKTTYTEDGKIDEVSLAKARFQRVLERSRERSLRKERKEEKNRQKAKEGKDKDNKKKKKKKKGKKNKNKKEKKTEGTENEIDESFKYWFSPENVDKKRLQEAPTKKKAKPKSKRKRIAFNEARDTEMESKDAVVENSLSEIEHTERTWSSSMGSDLHLSLSFSSHMRKISEDNNTIDTTDHTSSRSHSHSRMWWDGNEDTAPKTPSRTKTKIVFPLLLSPDCDSLDSEDEDISMIDDDENSQSDRMFDELSCILDYESDSGYNLESKRSLLEVLLEINNEDDSIESESLCSGPYSPYTKPRKQNSKTKDDSEKQGELVVTSPQTYTCDSGIYVQRCPPNSYKRIGMDGVVK